MAKPFLSLIIPVLNDAEQLPLTLIEADRLFSAEEFSYEIIVVDDGSKDATSVAAKHLSEALKNIKVIDNTEQRGIGTAMHIGMLSAKGTWRIIIPQSTETSFVWICEKLRKMQPGANAHVFLLEGTPSFFKKLIRSVMSMIRRILFQSHITIFSPIAACFSSEAATRIFPLLQTKQEGMLEALLIGEKLGYFPIERTLSLSESVRLREKPYLQTLIETIKIRWWLWRKAYRF